MQTNQRGRSLASLRNTQFAQTFCATTTSAEAIALRYLLRQLDPSELHARLLHFATSLASGKVLSGPDTPKDLFLAFEELNIGPTRQARVAVEGPEADIERHCARCHNSYLERDNGLEECLIPHDRAVQIELKDAEGRFVGRVGHYYPCCDVCLPTHVSLESHLGDGAEKGSGKWCFAGRHTTQKAVVEYNDTNVPECWVKRCKGALPPFHQQMFGWKDEREVGEGMVRAVGGVKWEEEEVRLV